MPMRVRLSRIARREPAEQDTPLLLLEIHLQSVDQVFSGPGLLIGRLAVPIENVITNMAVDHLGHQGVQRSPANRNCMKDVRAVHLLFQGSNDNIYLSANAARAV